MRSSSVKGTVPHGAVERLRDTPQLQSLLVALVQYRRAAKTELMSPAQMQHTGRVIQQLQETLRLLLVPQPLHDNHE